MPHTDHNTGYAGIIVRVVIYGSSSRLIADGSDMASGSIGSVRTRIDALSWP